MKSIKLLALALIATISFSSCSDDDDPTPVNEEEVITTVTVTLVNGNDTVILKSFDADGDGPGAPVITTSGGNLKKGVTYSGSIELLNETESPAEDITEEVKEEGNEHQFFYTATNNVGTFSYADTESNGNPIGVKFNMTTSSDAKTGKVTFTLKHEPTKPNTGLSSAGGNTDVEVTFDVTVE